MAFWRLRQSLRASWRGVFGFTRPSIGEALSFRAADRIFGTFRVLNAKLGVAIVAKLKFGKVAVQMSFARLSIA